MDEAEAQALVGKTALAGAVAAISAASPELGIAASAALPALDVAVERWQAVRAARTVRALEAAAAKANMTADDVVDRLVADPECITLLATALNAAANTALETKIAALGQSLGTLATDPATVDIEYLWIRIFSDIDAPHVRALLELLKEGKEGPGHLRLVRPGDLDHFVRPSAMALVVLQTLERHGLAQRPDPEGLHAHTRAAYGMGPPTMERLSGIWFMAGDLARECHQRLENAGRSEGSTTDVPDADPTFDPMSHSDHG